MAGEGIPYRADTGGGVSPSPDLRAPLGPPNILRPEDFIAMANFNDPTVALKNAADLTSSLIDNHYRNQMALAKSQADLAETAARTGQIGANVDLLKQDYENRAQLNPIIQKQAQNRLDSDSILLDRAKRDAQDQNTAIAQMPEATSALPNPDDPDYADKRDQWRLKYNNLLTNPATRTRMEGEYQAVDGIYQNRMLTQQNNNKRKEFSDLQTSGFIPSPINPDQAMKGPDADNLLTKGRMLQARHQTEMLASQFPADSPVRGQLQSILDETDKDTGSDTGVQDVMAGKSKVFDTNGRLTGVSQAALQQAQNTLAAQAQAAGKEIPKTTIEVPFGKPNVKGEYPGKMTISGMAPSVGEQLAQRYGLTTPDTQQPAEGAAAGANLIQDPAVRDLAGRYQRREITRDQFIEGLKNLPAPSTQPSTQQVPYGPGNQNLGAAGPAAAPFQPDTSGSKRLNAIYNNPGALGLSDLGRRYGATDSGKVDTGHPFAQFPTKEAGAAAQFSLWQNKDHYLNHSLKDAITSWIGPGEHGEAEYISSKTGIPLDQVITDDLLRSPQGIRLMQAQAEYEGQNVLTQEQWKRAQDWAYKGINPFA
jgi:hypothetical protein